ncbi:MAG: adenosylcobinamide-GDP ribazoletransferase [Crocosphaera sp.]|nr:adenosylcobinamide-GDP ribazoletransferase [Crocosphaera sp.]
MFKELTKTLDNSLNSILGAIIFYTIIPIPHHWVKNFQAVARWAPLIGLTIGAILGIMDQGLTWIGFPISIRSALIAALGLYLTGGLHLDGVMDSGDGLAVTEEEKRLTVMQDSVTGAFGVMAGVMVIILKIIALSSISQDRWWGLMLASGWGRWGQVCAIAFYPYLKPTGKGAFHKQYLQVPEDVLGSLFGLWTITGLLILLEPEKWLFRGMEGMMAMAIALGVGFWFNQRFGGHTGDTYGAVVEWSETFILCSLTISILQEFPN